MKGKAREWLGEFEAKEAAGCSSQMMLESMKEALLMEFRRKEDPDDIWHELKQLKQGESQSVASYVTMYGELWTRWCSALETQFSPMFVKKKQFIASLKQNLSIKVDLKQPSTYEEAIQIAKDKEWKMQKQVEYGMLDDQVKSPSYADVNVIQGEKMVQHASLKCEQVGRGIYHVSPSLLASLNFVVETKSKEVDKICKLDMRKQYP